MLRTNLRGNWPAGSREEDLRRVFTIYGHDGHLGHVACIIPINFDFHLPKSLHTKFE